jgi:AraC-like DNA-binding protein
VIARVHRPGFPLAGFVDCFWHFDGYPSSHARERALPTGTVKLVVNLHEDRMRVFLREDDFEGQRFRGSVVCGAQAGYFVLEPSQQMSVVGIHFRPGGAAPFLGEPAGEFTNRHLGLDDVWGAPEASELRERLLEAGSSEAMFGVLEYALLNRLQRPLLAHPAVAYALRQLAARPAVSHISDIQDQTGYGAKRFIELFRNAVGLTPKVYCRIMRFQSVIERLACGRRVEWASVALDGGYCDQSHLNREFRALSGLTPSEYRPGDDDRPNHVPIDR